MTYTHYEHTTKSIFLVHMTDEPSKPWSELVQKGLKKLFGQGKKVSILVNKKGYASGTICNECGFIPRCDQCDVAVAVHHDAQGNTLGLCHICRKQYSVEDTCSHCGCEETTSYGMGSQQVADWVLENYGIRPALLENKTANSLNKSETLGASLKDTQVIVGTSLLTQPIVGWTPDAVVIVNADIGLNVPDFQAYWNNFTLLYDCFTNLGATTYLVQTYNEESPSITHACNLDLEGMKKHELAYREEYNYPPYNEMCVLLYKHEIEETLFNTTNKLYQELMYIKEQYEMKDLEIYTTPPMIYKMYGKYRYSIILKGSQVRQFMDIVYSKLKIATRGFKVDWEPQQLL